jgi:predicted nucleic acid-binding protein
MNYFDSDVLINSLVNQNPIKHINSINRIEASIFDNSFTISWLTIQEVAFVLRKLRQENSFISSKLIHLINSVPLEYNARISTSH